MNTRRVPLIKMCGMTREEDAALAIRLGADAIGMLFYEKSPRFVSMAQAARIAESLPSGAIKVGLFVNASAAEVTKTLAHVPLDILQFHGDEPQAFCADFGLPFWKTVRAKDDADLPELVAAYPQAQGILLDSWHPTKAGGTGETFDWSILDGISMLQHLILAGGLNADNVAAAITQVNPWAVDVCSGIESSPGIKSEQRMQEFINTVKRG